MFLVVAGLSYTVYVTRRHLSLRTPGDSMRFQFQFEKALQASAWLLKRSGESRTLEHAKLLKLLYLADRLSLLETGFPITGDAVVMMPNGPVLSRVYDCIKHSSGEQHSGEWGRFIERDGKYLVRLVANPSECFLSHRDEMILETVWAEHGGKTWQELFDFAAKLPEKREYSPGPFRRRRDVPPDGLLEVLGFSSDDIDSIENDIEQFERTKRLLA